VRAGRLIDAGLTFVGNLFFARLSHRLRWRTRLGAGGTLAYVLAWTAAVVLFVWFANRLAQRQERMWAEVRERLGREPTSDEVFEHFQPHEST
jgi:hypothetical protein